MPVKDYSIDQVPNTDYVSETSDCDSFDSPIEAASKEMKEQDSADEPTKDIYSKRPQVEIGGRDGPDPTRYGDWEKNGRCIDF